MGIHTIALSDDWSTCTRCNQKLEHGVCLCCGAGGKSVCYKYPKCREWAIGDNRGCDKHLRKTDFLFPDDFPPCKHIKAEEKARNAGWSIK